MSDQQRQQKEPVAAAPAASGVTFTDPATGKTVSAKPVQVEDPASFSSDIRLADGNVLRVRVVVAEVLKADGMLDAHGRPIYQVNSIILASVKDSPQP